MQTRHWLFRVLLFGGSLLFLPTLSHSTPHSGPPPLAERIPPKKLSHPAIVARYQTARHTNQVSLHIKLIYAHVRRKRYVDARLQRDVPGLHQMYDFNAYHLLRTRLFKTPYGHTTTIQISRRYQVKITPQKFDKKKQRITLNAVFLHRKNRKARSSSKFTQYASTQVKLSDGKKVAFLGPTYRYGRILMILRVKQM